MTGWSLTSPEPLTGQRDPNVLPPVPGQDYAARAITAWLEAQHGSLDMDDVNRAIQETRERLDAGREWLKTHDERHPKHNRARWLHRDLEDRLRSQLSQLRVTAYACWVHCLELYACLQHVDRAAWVANHAPGQFNGDTPQSIWHALRGTQVPPGRWPPEDSEAWINRRVSYLETWNMELLNERLQERLKKTGETA